jgi:DNA topoisomerase-3
LSQQRFGAAAQKVTEGKFQMRHAPQDRIVRRDIADDVVKAERL